MGTNSLAKHIHGRLNVNVHPNVKELAEALAGEAGYSSFSAYVEAALREKNLRERRRAATHPIVSLTTPERTTR